LRGGYPSYGEIPRTDDGEEETVDEPRDGTPGWWSRTQRVIKGLVALATEAAQMADALRRIIR